MKYNSLVTAQVTWCTLSSSILFIEEIRRVAVEHNATRISTSTLFVWSKSYTLVSPGSQVFRDCMTPIQRKTPNGVFRVVLIVKMSDIVMLVIE